MFWNILVLAWVQADNACANAAVALVRDHDLLLSGSAPVPAHRGCSLALLVDCLWSRQPAAMQAAANVARVSAKHCSDFRLH